MSDEDDIRIGRIVAFAEREINDEIEAIAQMVENIDGWKIAGDDPARVQWASVDVYGTIENIAAAIRARKRSI